MFGVPCCIAAYFLSKVKLRSPGTWVRICLFLPLIGFVLLAILPKGNYPPGHCENCGYNLTGNVSGVCPECGEKVEVV